MDIRTYRDFVLVAENVEWNESEMRQFTVRVFSSPAGESPPVQRPVPPGLQPNLRRLDRRELTIAEIGSIARVLADLLLPAQVRELLIRTLDRLQEGQGVRLRLRLANGLTQIPWEYLYVPVGADTGDTTGFLALDPRVSIVRHESLPISGDLATAPKQRRLLVVLSSPTDGSLPPLNLAQERNYIQLALRDTPGIVPDFLENATIQHLGEKLSGGVDIFHFAGHGVFDMTGQGEGAIVLVTDDGAPAFIPADQLAVNLRGKGVQLVVLGACETGLHRGYDVWNSVAAAMMKAEIPAAVAMQHSLWDESALVFTRSFYQALATGLPLDQAVSLGRLAIYNLCHPQRNDPTLSLFWPDWGTPVLYLRTAQDFVLPAQQVEGQLRPVGDAHPPPLELPLSSLAADQRALIDLAEKLQNRRLTLFIGGDLAEEVAGLPSRQALADRLAIQEGIVPGQRLATIAQQVMSHGSRWDFTNFLIQALQPDRIQPGPFYQEVARLVQATRPDLVITTAYHRLLELALQRQASNNQGGIAFNRVVQDEALRFVDSNRVTILKLYGDIQQVDTLIVTEQDQNALLRGREKPDMVDEVRRAFRHSSLLFLGYDLRDPAVSALFDEVAGHRFQARSYAVWPELSQRERESFERNRGLTVLATDPLTTVQTLLETVESPSIESTDPATDKE